MMKNALRLMLLLVAGALLHRADAVPATPYLNDISNIVSQAYAATTDSPRINRLLGKALHDFDRPSTNAAGDFNIFFAVATHLLPLQHVPQAQELTGPLGSALSNAFTNFMMEAVLEIGAASGPDRLAGISDFHPLKRPAARQLAAAVRSLNIVLHTSSTQIGILAVRQAYGHITAANKLIDRALLTPDKARDSLAGTVLSHTQNDTTETTTFGETDYSNGDGSTGTYTYRRTGMNTGLLVLTEDGRVTTVRITFTSTTGGRFTYRATGTSHERGHGTFTLADVTPL